MIVTAEQEIAHLQMGRPHVVILGAGASYAACPDGDQSGRRLPLMSNFIELLDLGRIFDKTDLQYNGRNFEDVCSELFIRDEYIEVRQDLEQRIYDYFSVLQLRDTPNLYDHLVLSLREKDVIATFNWDPFLVQAFRRNSRRCHLPRLPRLLFLHGNVLIAYCEKGMVMGFNGNACSKCGCLLVPSRLLYPIYEKNYEKDGFIAKQWRELAGHLENAFMVSLFGYGAPKSDVAAIELLKNAWGTANERSMDEIEIINILPEDELFAKWEPFIYSHHYTTSDNFYSSWLANHPRRTGEAHINQNIDGAPIENNPIPKNINIVELWDWFEKLAKVERTQSQSST